MKILLIEDEKRMAKAVSQLLSEEGYEVDCYREGVSGGQALNSGIYDAAVIDVMLPGKDGFSVVREARRNGIVTPLMLLTAKSDVSDKVVGLDSGADDYMTKPFLVEEFMARVRALCRRGLKSVDGLMKVGDLMLNVGTGVLSCTSSQQEIRLGEKEFHIMQCFMANPGRIISKDQLALKVWGYDNEAEYNNVEVYMSFTRKKMKFLNTMTKIKTVRGMGYMLEGVADGN
ncbi:response regulator transcription factor [Eubacterium oxidoreducens]|uniref:Stage 0 sporulation protein A homolog n=1 Tax=Eubacterium oxidoreducens TaxID=1732 RepID=A0A1G6AFC2_EUBOX|nr:response regulator transcription factor [Eubacterium oxidoreducens]SDB07114.1 DNA-binding response regulator, OmpR family, contains REC and winged-helix (wHTH) domain [Eubacterium oxidoreducens]